MKKEKKIIGNLGEEIACGYLINRGYKIIERNFSCYEGEIDIIAKDKEEYVFCEVKTRKNLKYGNPIEAVNKKKTIHLWETAKYYLYVNCLLEKCVRFDVIEVYLHKGKSYINHVKNIIEN